MVLMDAPDWFYWLLTALLIVLGIVALVVTICLTAIVFFAVRGGVRLVRSRFGADPGRFAKPF